MSGKNGLQTVSEFGQPLLVSFFWHLGCWAEAFPKGGSESLFYSASLAVWSLKAKVSRLFVRPPELDFLWNRTEGA